jgi:23S rRNA (uracil1939-C5)-methyltransferase
VIDPHPPARPSAPAPVRIDRLATGGDGVGRLEDGRTLFIPRSAPGDLVEVTGLRIHKRFARGRVGRLVEEGAGRVAPVCAHYERDHCGGCQLQHLDARRQVEAKQNIIGEALRRLGKLDVADPVVEMAAEPFGYRTKVTLARGPGGSFGFHREGESDRVFALERCELMAPALQEGWERLRPLLRTLPADAQRLVLRLDRAGAVHLVIETIGQRSWKADPLAVVGTVWWHPSAGAARVIAGGDARTAYPATVFEQVNPVMGDRVRAFAVTQAGNVHGMHCWDLYAGIGETTDLLLAGGASVESIEGDKRAVEVAAKRTPGARRIAGRVEEAIRDLRRAELVITNPPRVGMDPMVVDHLAAVRPKTLVYVSCDPATLARDVARLGSGWKVTGLRGFDLFPQTAHVETVLTLEGV